MRVSRIVRVIRVARTAGLARLASTASASTTSVLQDLSGRLRQRVRDAATPSSRSWSLRRPQGPLPTPRTALEVAVFDALRRGPDEVLSLLRRCSPTDLNAVLLAPAFPSPEPTRDEGSLLLMHVLEGAQRTRTRALLLDLLARQRLADLSVAARAVLVRVLQEERRAFFSLSGLLMRAVADVLVGTSGHDLVRLKTLLHRSGPGYDLPRLVFHDLSRRSLQVEVLQHFAVEAARLEWTDALAHHARGDVLSAHALFPSRDPHHPHASLSAPGASPFAPPLYHPVHVLSDLDDTIQLMLHDARFPRGTVYPGVLSFLRELRHRAVVPHAHRDPRGPREGTPGRVVQTPLASGPSLFAVPGSTSKQTVAVFVWTSAGLASEPALPTPNDLDLEDVSGDTQAAPRPEDPRMREPNWWPRWRAIKGDDEGEEIISEEEEEEEEEEAVEVDGDGNGDGHDGAGKAKPGNDGGVKGSRGGEGSEQGTEATSESRLRRWRSRVRRTVLLAAGENPTAHPVFPAIDTAAGASGSKALPAVEEGIGSDTSDDSDADGAWSARQLVWSAEQATSARPGPGTVDTVIDTVSTGECGSLFIVTARPSGVKSIGTTLTRRQLRTLGVTDAVVLSGSLLGTRSLDAMVESKIENFQKVFSVFPESSFVFLGDSGQGDAVVASFLLERHRDQVLAALIHDVRQGPTTAHKVPKQAFVDAGVVFFDTFVEAARHALERGLLDPAAVQRVARDAMEELERLDWNLLSDHAHEHEWRLRRIAVAEGVAREAKRVGWPESDGWMERFRSR